MEELRSTVTTLTGAMNRFMEQVKGVETRIGNIEASLSNNALGQVISRLEFLENSQAAAVGAVVSEEGPLQRPRTEDDLKDISRLPDSVKELRSFDGNPTQYISWIHSVETILKDFEIVRQKPIYRAIVQSIRQKVVGAADTALISYNVFDDDWNEIKKILSLHYADKRDIQTLEHQLNQLSQGSSKMDEFYASVNHQLSLIINKLKTESYSQETVRALIETYRNRALDVFVRGLSTDLSRMIIIQKPKTLPEAYSACLELQNLTMRNNILHIKGNNRITVPTSIGTADRQFPPRPPKSYPIRQNNYWQPRNYKQNWRSGYKPQNFREEFYDSKLRPPIPPRYPVTKSEPMDVDKTIQSRRINYINNPRSMVKRNQPEEYISNKQPRLYHIEAQEENASGAQDDIAQPDIVDEVNFMGVSRQAYLT